MEVLIIDDEKPNRSGLRLLIEQYCPGFNVVGEADSAESTRNFLTGHHADILLLDINMPNENGFELLSSIDVNKYQVVFVTAYAEYAIRAFRANAVDYLLKPVDVDDLKDALSRCMSRHSNLPDNAHELPSVYNESLRNAISDAHNKEYPSKLTLPHKQGFKIINTKEIGYLEASGNYTVIYLENKEDLVVTRSIKEFESLLSPVVFFRVHKSSIINLEHVLEYSSVDGHIVIMKNGQQVAISRRRLDDFMMAIDNLSRRI